MFSKVSKWELIFWAMFLGISVATLTLSTSIDNCSMLIVNYNDSQKI